MIDLENQRELESDEAKLLWEMNDNKKKPAKLLPGEELTRLSYDRIASMWEAGHQKPFWQPEFAKLKKLLLAGRVIEVGCGAGRDAEELVKLGYDYLGTDISAAMVAEASRRNPEGKFKKLSVYEIPSDHSFDAFWCAATLIHVPKARTDEAIKALKKSIRPEGFGFISVKEGDGEGEEKREELDDRSFLFVYHQPAQFEQILKDNGFRILSFRRQYVSERTTWLIYLLQSR